MIRIGECVDKKKDPLRVLVIVTVAGQLLAKGGAYWDILPRITGAQTSKKAISVPIATSAFFIKSPENRSVSFPLFCVMWGNQDIAM